MTPSSGPVRLAVELGTARIRLAKSGGSSSPDSVVVPIEPTGEPAGAASLAAAIRASVPGGRADELVVVYPARWSERDVRAAVGELAECAGTVRALPAPVAVALEVDADTPLPPGPLAILRWDEATASADVLADLIVDEGRVLATSARPDPVAALAASAADAGVPPYALTGGVLLLTDSARPDRELTEVVDRLTELIGAAPSVLPRAAELPALGGLRHVPRLSSRAAACAALPGLVPAFAGPVPAAPLCATLPMPSSNGRRVSPAALGKFLAVALVAGLLTALVTNLAGGTRSGIPAERPAARAAQATSRTLAQYDYAVALPLGWRHSGGQPERRRTLLTPAEHPHGSDVISIEQNPLGYDSAARPERAPRELRDHYQRALADGAALSDFTPSLRVAGRDVTSYRQRQPRLGAQVDWYVLFVRDTQLSVGCQYTPEGAQRVRQGCVEVLRSLRLLR